MGWQRNHYLSSPCYDSISNLVSEHYSFYCIGNFVSLLLRKRVSGETGVMFLLFLVNFVAKKNFVGKTNAQPIYTTTTTGPMVMQDVTAITGVCLVQVHQHLTLGVGVP